MTNFERSIYRRAIEALMVACEAGVYLDKPESELVCLVAHVATVHRLTFADVWETLGDALLMVVANEGGQESRRVLYWFRRLGESDVCREAAVIYGKGERKETGRR